MITPKKRMALIAGDKNITFLWFHTRIMKNETAIKRAQQRVIFLFLKLVKEKEI